MTSLNIRRPNASDNKYSRGVVGFLTGSHEFPGAAILGVGAALNTGIGMVRYLGPREVGNQVVQSFPETVLEFGRMDSLVIGSGRLAPLSNLEYVWLEGLQTAVIDAGALETIDFLKTPPSSILTPHFGEFQRLERRMGFTAMSEEPSVSAALRMSAVTQRFILLKGSTTFLASPTGECLQVGPLSSWLATAGTGDVLAGILGALLAANADLIKSDPGQILQVADLAVRLHSRAAEIASETAPVSAHALLATLGQAALESLQ